jgi:multiple sugar transport system ATP-binding protein
MSFLTRPFKENLTSRSPLVQATCGRVVAFPGHDVDVGYVKPGTRLLLGGECGLATVELRGIEKVYPGGIEAVRPLDLTIGDGDLFVIVGPSGSGKSTILRLIAGLETPGAGSLWIDGRRADGLSPRDRDLAMVFQVPVLYPYLSVFENLAFGLRARRSAWREVEQGVSEVATLLGLGGLLDRRPATLSGGQRQRVALGRALIRKPRVFLLDEPFSSLDAPLRTALRAELIDVQRRLGTTMIHVTHDQGEALALATRIAVLNDGRIVQTGAPRDVYDRPASRFVGEFLGSPPMNILPCMVDVSESTLQLRIVGVPDEDAWTIGEGAAWAGPLRHRGAGRVDLGVRPEHVRMGDALIVVRALVRRLEPLGHETVAILAVGPHALSLRLPAHTMIGVGTPIAVGLDPDRIVWFDPETGLALR